MFEFDWANYYAVKRTLAEMATTEKTDLSGRMHIGEDAKRIVESMRVAVTGSPLVSLRLLLLISIVAAVCSTAPFPLNMVAAVAWAIVAYDLGRLRRA